MPVASIDGGDSYKVFQIKTLGLVKDADARKLLDDVAKQVQPIMRKRKWKVPLLSEFCPNNPSLLGLNIDGGREIRIRLRRHRSDPQLMPYEDTLGTMLHELTHIQCGPHNAAFYKLLDELKKECEELMINGIKGTGQGFDARGQRLGGYRHNPPTTNLRQVALAAAEKRANQGMFSGPRRLGGDSNIMNSLSPIQAAAMAAERRLRDDLWCAAPVTAGADGLDRAQEREESSGSQANDTKDLNDFASKENHGLRENPQSSTPSGIDSARKFGDTPIPPKRKRGPALTSQPGGGASFDGAGNHSSPIVVSDVCERITQQHESSWECHVCTLLNVAPAIACQVCSTPKMEAADARSWTCKFCTLRNEELQANCGVCGQWRFSYGAPMSSRAPYVGT